MKNILRQGPVVTKGRLEASVKFVGDTLKDKIVLDIGCGFGWFVKSCLDRGAKEVFGTELSEKDLKTVTDEIIDKKARFKVSNSLNLDFPDNYFDVVTCWEVLEHIPKNSEAQLYSEVMRVLKPGGTFYLSTPYASFFSKIFDPAWWFGHRHYKYSQLKEFGMGSGFNLVEYRIYGKWWTILNTLNMYLAKWVFRRTPFLPGFFLPKEDLEYSNGKGFVNIFLKYTK